MKVIKSFLSHAEKLIGILLGLFAMVVVLLMAGLFFVVFGELVIIFELLKVSKEIINHGHAEAGQVIFLLLELVDLTLVSILLVIIATTAFRMISEMVYGPIDDNSKEQSNEQKSIGILNMSGKISKNLEAKLVFSIIGLAAVSILGALFELSSKIQKGEFHYETIPVEYYIFGAGYLLLIITSAAVILLSNAEKE
jgi:uncharacterized membrane protein YqhA